VFGIPTIGSLAKMIRLFALWNWAFEQFVRKLMDEAIQPELDINSPIAMLVGVAHPQPALADLDRSAQ
jgi:hypothetical protein